MIEGWHPAYLSVAAGAVTILLGAFVLARHPARGLHRAFFAYALTSGAMLLLTASVNLRPGTPEGLLATRVYWYLQPFFLALVPLVALHVPTPAGLLLRRPLLAHALLLAPPAALVAAYALDHGILFAPATLAGVPYYALTPLGSALLALQGLVVGAALVVLARRFRSTPHQLQRTQIAWTQAAMLIAFVPVLGVRFAFQAFSNPASVATFGFGIGLALAHAGALASLLPWNRSLVQDEDRQVVAVSYVVGSALTAAFAILSIATVSALTTFVGLASLAGPLVLTYAVLKFDLFALDLRLRRAAPQITLGLVLAAAFATTLAVLGRVAPAADASRLFLVAGVVTAAAAFPIHRATTRLATRLGWTRDYQAGDVAERRLEIYRAAVENAVSRGENPDASGWLTDLRERLALSTRDHRLMVQVVAEAAEKAPAAPRGPLREGDLVLRKYRVEKFLGSGSFGRALLATHVTTGRKVVIKEPHEAFRTRAALAQLSKEARLAARVSHPNVVALHDFEELEDTGYLVFEHVPGGSLEARLASGPMPREEAYRVLADLLSGLEAIHASKIVHMDLKPANILLAGPSGPAKISDFGIASEIRMDATLGRSVGAQAHPGTLLYMAPEQVRGRRDPGPRADLYAVGAILHEMLTGTRYLDFPDNPLMIQEAILYKAPRLDDPRLTPFEQDLLASLLAKAPADRPASAAEALARVRDADGSRGRAGAADLANRAALREA